MAFDFNKVIEDFKEKLGEITSSLPFGKKVDSDDDEDLDEGTEIIKKERHSEEDEEVESSGSETRSKIIKAIIVLGIIFFAVDEFYLSKQNVEEVPPPVVKKKKKRAKVKKDETSQSEQMKETKNALVDSQKVEAQVEPPQKNDMVQREDSELNEKGEKEMEMESQLSALEETLENKTEEVPKETPRNNVTQNEESIEEQESQPEEVGQTVSSEDVSVKKSEEIPLNQQMGEIVEKIEEPKVDKYVPAPQYSSMGRGLVYNCKDKHWACVDKDEFFACKDNEKWNTKNGKSVECHAVGSYSTTRDCRVVQVYNVNMAVKSDFCNRK